MTALRFLACLTVLTFAAPAADEDPPVPAHQLRVREKVDPVYPPWATRYGIQGTVRFAAIVGKDGHVESLRLISGHPLLVPAARVAAWQWVFFPPTVHGEAVRAITQIEVSFRSGAYLAPPQGVRESEGQVRT